MLFPIIAEAIFDTRFSVQAPYFNSFAPPVGMALLALMAAKSMGARGTRRRAVLGPLLLALATALAYRWFMPGYTGDAAVPAAALAGVFCVALCFGAMGWRMARIGARRLVTHRFRSRLAGLVHIGATLAMLGFVGAYHTQNGQLTLRPGERQQLGRFTFLLQGPVVRHEVAHAVHYETSLAVFDRETSVGVATPSIAVYPTGNEASITEVSLLTVGLMDVYVVLSDWDKTDPQGAVTIGVYLNPFVLLVWVAVALMAGGGACALALPGRKRSQG